MASSLARVLNVCELVCLALGEEAEARRVYQVDVRVEEQSGRKVYVFPSAYSTPELATRREDIGEYIVNVAVVERYEGEGTPPDEWLDERVLWVEENVFDVLENPRTVPSVLEGYWPERSDASPVYDLDLLREQKLFFAVVTITFRTFE